MRTDIDHLPGQKQQELQAAVRILFEEFAAAIGNTTAPWKKQGRILKVILYGSYARGDWVDDPVGGYKSDYDLLVVVNDERLTKDQPVPCIIREAGMAEEDSLAENMMRVSLHPLDQFRAFSALIEQGLSEEDIAARFFVPVATVRQRLRLVSVSPSLLEAYGEDWMTLEQLMAFSVTANQLRQEQVWAQIGQASHMPAYQIRRLLIEDAIACSDRRARLIGLDAYVAAGGHVMRDLFSAAEDGWLQDVELVDKLVSLKLEEKAAELRAEGWKWVEAAVDLPFGCENGKRRLAGAKPELTDEERLQLTTLMAEYDSLAEGYDDGIDLPADVEQQLLTLDGQIAALSDRPPVYEAADMGKAGVFVALAWDGSLRIADSEYALALPDADSVASDQAKGFARRRDISLDGSACLEPGTMYPGDGAVLVGNRADDCRIMGAGGLPIASRRTIRATRVIADR